MFNLKPYVSLYMFLLFWGGTPIQTAAQSPSPPTFQAASPDTTFFGYSIFETDQPADSISLSNVDPSYPIGPGDELIITIWGQVERNLTQVVDRGGSINVARVGRLQVAGTAIDQLPQKISRFLARAYSGISEDATKATTFIDVSLGKLRALRIFVVGEVYRPGAYVLDATAAPLDALYRARGPTKKGSLRNIQVVRKNNVIGQVDLYRFIQMGDRNESVRLQNGDVIQVPPVGPQIWLKGRVHRPAIYELKPGESVNQLLQIAGGVEPDAFTKRIQIERIVQHRERQLIDIDLSTVSETAAELFDGDVITVFPIRNEYVNAIYVSGQVKNPGRYQLHSNMTLKELVSVCDGLLPEAYHARADLVRILPDQHKTLLSIHLGKALDEDSNHNLLLQPQDSLIVYSVHTFREKPTITINGLVRTPGTYELYAHMGIQDLIAKAGGLRDQAYTLEAEIVRTQPNHPPQIIHQPLVKTLDVAQADTFSLQHRDAVFIRRHPDFGPRQQVILTGHVRFRGEYALTPTANHLTQVIQRAGGLKDTAYPDGIEFYRPSTGRIPVNLPKALKNPGGPEDLILQNDDKIHLPSKPTTVDVSGAVYKPGPVLFQAGKGASYYLNRAGGTTKKAHKSGTYLIRANGEVRKLKTGLFGGRSNINPGSHIVVPFKISARPKFTVSDTAQ